MDHFNIPQLKVFNLKTLPTKYQVLGRLQFVISTCPQLSHNKIAEFVAQQVFYLWKAHQIPSLDVNKITTKILHIFTKWKTIDRQRASTHPDIRKKRADLHHSLGIIFDVLNGGLTKVKEKSSRQFYIDSTDPDFIWKTPIERKPKLAIDRRFFDQSPLAIRVQTRGRGDSTHTEKGSETVKAKQSKPQATDPQLLESDDDQGDDREESEQSLNPSFAQRLADIKSSKLRKTRSNARNTTVQAKKESNKNRTSSALEVLQAKRDYEKQQKQQEQDRESVASSSTLAGGSSPFCKRDFRGRFLRQKVVEGKF